MQDSVQGEDSAGHKVTSITHSFWCSMLVTMCLRSRTRFAAFLSQSLQHRFPVQGKVLTLFPIPTPPGCPSGKMPKGLSAKRRRSFHRLRALHTMVMALNFWHSGGDFHDLTLISRSPNQVHRSIYKRLMAFLLSDGWFQAFDLVPAGRKFHQLDARLSEIFHFVAMTGMSSSPYTRDYEGCKVDTDNGKYPELDPYHKADPQRIKITGEGKWDVTSLLSDPLVMAYREPAVLATGSPAPPGSYPRMTETPFGACWHC